MQATSYINSLFDDIHASTFSECTSINESKGNTCRIVDKYSFTSLFLPIIFILNCIFTLIVQSISKTIRLNYIVLDVGIGHAFDMPYSVTHGDDRHAMSCILADVM